MALATIQLVYNREEQKNYLYCQGNWTLSGINVVQLKKQLANIKQQNINSLTLETSMLTRMDSSGAWQLYHWQQQLSLPNKEIPIVGLTGKYRTLFDMVGNAAKKIKPLPIEKKLTGLALLGKKTLEQLKEAHSFLRFIGKTFLIGWNTLCHPKQLRGRAIINIIENTGLDALGIIALLSFMIGIVLTYQMGFQLKNFGATLFIIDLLGLAILREFAPLLTAIMVAGRSGSAFTAELGMMKIKEEVDALNTMGVLPSQLLILPRIWGLLIALPLLTVWADIFGLLGGMAMTHNMLHISYSDFLQRFPKVVTLSSLLIGIGKAPVFALIIASSACFQGLRVSGSADSVGRKTTRSVVQGIFFIIVADALFSILFSKLNI